MTKPGCNDGPFRHCEAHSQVRHCEARSAVAIYAFDQPPQWIASFLAMTGPGAQRQGGGAMTGRGRNDGAGALSRPLFVIARRAAPWQSTLRYCQSQGIVEPRLPFKKFIEQGQQAGQF
jgi:hypothetical protein